MSEPLESSNAWIETDDGRQLKLENNCRLGRKPGSDILIGGAKVSREHAIIHIQDDFQFWLIDLGSLNGTFLNDQRVLQPTRLHNGDRIVIAGATFHFRQQGTPTSAGGGMTTVMASQATVMDLVDRKVWLLIVDVEGFTELSRTVAADKLAPQIGTWIQKGQHVIEKSGGKISQFLGDGFLACWETVGNQKLELSVAQAVEGFHEMRQSGPLKFRTIVHHGTIAVGGAVRLGAEGMFGPELNYIFRLEKLAAGLRVNECVSEKAQPSLAAHLPLEEVPGEHILKGYPGKQRCFRINRPGS
jgi:adenylate cyclase